MITNLCLDGVLKNNNIELYIGYDTEEINHSVITMINDTHIEYMQLNDIINNLKTLGIEYDDINKIMLLRDSKIKTFKFLNSLFTKYKAYIDSLELRIEIKNHTNNKYIDNAGIDAPDLNLYLNTKFYINDVEKQKVDKSIFIFNTSHRYRNIELTAVPIIEINNEFNNIFKDFDEEIFTTGIKPNLLNQLKDNIITCYEFEITDETKNQKEDIRNKIKTQSLTEDEKRIDNLLDEVISTDPNVPEGYIFKNKYISINDEFQNILRNTNPKPITLNDTLYLLKFIENLL